MKAHVFFIVAFLSIVTFCSGTIQTLDYQVNDHNDVEITIPFCGSIAEFEQTIINSLTLWKEKKHKAVWCALPVAHAPYLPSLLRMNFVLHHSTEKQIVLTLWLNEQPENILPSFCTHIVGVAGLVIDADDNVLCVKELYGKDRKSYYGLPGGGVQPHEDLADAAIREVFEETSIQTAFEAIVAFRHGGQWPVALDSVNKFYFCILLRPLTNIIKIQETEIADACWMPVEAFKKQAEGISAKFITLYEEGGPFISRHLFNQKTNTFVYK